MSTILKTDWEVPCLYVVSRESPRSSYQRRICLRSSKVFFLFPTLVTGSSAVHFSPGYPTFALCSSRNEPPQGYPADLWASWCPRRISKMCHPPVAISDPSLKEKERYACRAHLPQLEHETKNIRSVLLTSSRL